MSLEPWLCYYCGDCSTTCPRQAEPGESMMTLRRYLTSQYDWTGLAAKFYKSKIWEIVALIIVSALVLLLAILFHGPIVTNEVKLTTFAPVKLVHTFDMIIFFILTFFVLCGAFRMFWFTMIQDKSVKIPLILYFTQLKELIIHAVTQKRLLECKDKSIWIKHWLLASGYVLMFTLVVGFLYWFQTDNIYPIYHPQRWIGYYATVCLVVVSVDILISRMKKIKQIHKFSHFTDWTFPLLLLLTAISGILVHIFRYLGYPLATYYMFVIHLMIAVPMLVVEVPFGKWAHIYYRPLAIYFQKVKEKALQQQIKGEVKYSHE
jgi:hypothetical protein